MSVVSPELGVGTLEGGVSGSLRLLDAVGLSVSAVRMHRRFHLRFGVPVPVRLARLVVLRRVLRLCEIGQYLGCVMKIAISLDLQ